MPVTDVPATVAACAVERPARGVHLQKCLLDDVLDARRAAHVPAQVALQAGRDAFIDGIERRRVPLRIASHRFVGRAQVADSSLPNTVEVRESFPRA